MYKLLINEDQSQIVESVRGFLATELPIERWRPAVNGDASSNGSANGHNDSNETHYWAQMAELGWFGLGVSEEAGGVGFGFAEEVLLMRECGRQLTSPSVMATILGAHVAVAGGNTELAQRLISGEQRIAMTLEAPLCEEDADSCQVYLFDHQPDDLVLVACHHALADTPIFFISESSQLRNLRELPCLDETVSMKAAELPMENSLCLVEDHGGLLCARSRVMLAAMCCGIAEAARDLSVEYAKIREQFGQPIGKFQAVKHKCTDMAVRAELAWAQTMEACLDLQHGNPNALLKSASAKWLASDAAYRNGDAAIQVHGGIGFQAECNAHLFVKRAHVYDQLGGTMQQQERKILAQASPL